MAPAESGTEGQNSTEIDIFEFTQGEYEVDEILSNPSLICLPKETVNNSSKRMIMTHHEWYSNHTDKCHSSSAIAEDFNFSNEWHTYGLYWDDYVLVWSIDGIPAKVVHRYFYDYFHFPWGLNRFYINNCDEIKDAIEEGYQIREVDGFPNETTSIILAQGVKNYGLNYNPNSNLNEACASSVAVFPKTMEIDWVRVWARRACESEYYVCETDNLPSNIAAKNIAFGSVYNPFTNSYSNCNVIVHNPKEGDAYAGWAQTYHNGQTIDAVASESIALLPGFKVQTGAEFYGRVEPCYSADLKLASAPTNTHIYNLLNVVEQDLLFKRNNGSKDYLQNIFIFPNPSTGIINIQYPESFNKNEIKIQLFDNTGRILYNLNNFTNTIDISAYANGIYYLTISTFTQTFHEKVIKN